jgi:putative membrane protein
MPGKPPSQNLNFGRAGLIAFTLLGLLLMAGLIEHADPDDVLRDVMRIGWGLGAVVLFHGLVMACDSVAWRVLVREPRRVMALLFLWARWVRESVNLLLPVAQVGGEVVSARMLVLRGQSLKSAGTSVVLDKLSEALSQIPYTLLGVALLVVLKGRDDRLVRDFVFGFAILATFGLGFAVAGRAGFFRLVRRGLMALGAKLRPRALAGVSGIASALRSSWNGERFAASTALHLSAWCVGAGESWLALCLMGHPVGIAQAFVIESLGQAVASVGFIVPGALGIQEGGYVAVGAALGLPAEILLALSLVKRLRQLSLGIPAILSWQALEFRRMLARSREPRKDLPSSDSNSYVRRFARALVSPFVDTGLTPNHVTSLRIVMAIAACTACAVGGTEWSHWAALFWILATVLDRADGEFARLTGLCSEWGHLYDYWSDVAINALVFFAAGVNLSHGAWGAWAILLGAVAAAIIAADAILAEQLETRIGEKSFPSRSGLDFDDIIFVLAPILWFRFYLPLLFGAVAGGLIVGFVLWGRLTKLAAERRQGRALAIPLRAGSGGAR